MLGQKVQRVPCTENPQCGEQGGERDGGGGGRVDVREFGLGDLGGRGAHLQGGGDRTSQGTGAGGALGVTQPGPS